MNKVPATSSHPITTRERNTIIGPSFATRMNSTTSCNGWHGKCSHDKGRNRRRMSHHNLRRLRFGFGFMATCLLSTAVLVLLLPTTVHAQQGPDLERCYEALAMADADTDGRVDSEEYVPFLQWYRPDISHLLSSSAGAGAGAGDEESMGVFANLPLDLQGNFYSLACACREDENQTDDECCVGDKAHLPSGNSNTSSSGGPPTAAQQSRLFTICFFTNSALDRLEGEEEQPGNGTTPPSVDPTLSPTSPGEIEVSYTIVVTSNGTVVVEDGGDDYDYESDLVAAMDDLVVQVADKLFKNQNRRLLRVMSTTTQRIRQRRSLQQQQQEETGRLQVQLPTILESVSDKGGFTLTPSTNAQGVYDGVGPCPADLGDPATDRCEEIVALVKVESTTTTTTATMDDQKIALQSALNDAILEGQLQESLQRTSPFSVATILSGQTTALLAVDDTTTTTDPPASTTLPPGFTVSGATGGDNAGITGGATAGIIVSAFAVVGMVGIFFVSRRGGPSADKNSKAILMEEEADPSGKKYASELQSCQPMESHELSASTKSIPESHIRDGKDRGSDDNYLIEEALSPTLPSPLSSSSFSPERPAVEPKTTAYLPAGHYSPDKTMTSEQSESGWSSDDVCNSSKSSVGSFDTEDAAGDNGSLGGGGGEEDEENGMLQMVDLQDIQGRGGISAYDNSPGDEHPGVTNLSHLEAAIMVGDWAAVGTSAAALASYDSETSTADGSFFSGTSQTGGGGSSTRAEEWKSRDASWSRAMDANKAVEIDKLIEQGDWEAVIQAAAKFEAEQTYGDGAAESFSSSKSEYYDPSQTTGSMLGTDKDESNSSMMDNDYDESMAEVMVAPFSSSSSNMMPGQGSYYNESATSIRSDVIELLRQVVPEEMDNVDEMLSQFEGREEDLIETLKAMEMRKEMDDDRLKNKKGET